MNRDGLVQPLYLKSRASMAATQHLSCKTLKGETLPSSNQTHHEMKTCQGGKTKIFALIKCKKGLRIRIGHFVAQTLGADQKKKIFESKSARTIFFCKES